MRRIDELHLEHPFAGARMLRDMLKLQGHDIGRKHVGTLIRKLDIRAMDTTYIPMRRGFVYLSAVLDWATRRVLAWRLSPFVDAQEEAIVKYGKPEIMNTDQGSQFTSSAFIGLLQEYRIQVSMDGKGC